MLVNLRAALRLNLIFLIASLLAAPLGTPLTAQGHEEHEQQPARLVSLLPQWEFRQEITGAKDPGAHLGVGLNVRADYYVRLGVAIAAGAVRRADDVWVGAPRVDLTARYLLDPFGDRPRGWYGGGGVSIVQRPGESATASLQLLVGLEGRRGNKITPSVELGVGGGVRVGVVLRRTRQTRSR
jgi:hypothetical protein